MSAHLQEAPLNFEGLFDNIPESCGATIAFVGSVRNNHEQRAVEGLSYSAHEPSAEARLAEICSEAKEKFAIESLQIHHRLGDLGLGDASVLVVCRSAHRAAAFDAARWALETLKSSVPIFKREHYSSGDAKWLDGQSLTEPDQP